MWKISLSSAKKVPHEVQQNITLSTKNTPFSTQILHLVQKYFIKYEKYFTEYKYKPKVLLLRIKNTSSEYENTSIEYKSTFTKH